MRVISEPLNLEAYRWGPSWQDMMDTATRIGHSGIMFELHTVDNSYTRRGVDILPELHLVDPRHRKHIVTPGLWVILYPDKEFRVVPNLDGYTKGTP